MSELAAAESALLTGPPADAIPALLECIAAGDSGDSGDSATTRIATWLVGVAHGAAGRYEAGWEALAEVAPGNDAAAALAEAAIASFHRQLGRHGSARSHDLRAAELCVGMTGPRWDEAHADAIIGLAADAVGQADLVGARHQLHRVKSLVQRTEPGWRSTVRLGWVGAEVALLSGDPALALLESQAAVDLARSVGAARHVAKSLIFSGVAHGELGELEEAATALTEAGRVAVGLAALPLVWPCHHVLARILDRLGKEVAAAESRELAAEAVTSIASVLTEPLRAEWTAQPDVREVLRTQGGWR